MTSLSTSCKVNWPYMLLLMILVITIAASIWYPNIWLQASLAMIMLHQWHANTLSPVAKHSRK
jgi:hypothetical protein